jgi:hypothetical protein
MNYKQRRVCWVALGLFCLSLLAVPVVTFNGSWTGSHVVGGIQYIPFFAVRASQKVRMDILSIEWIGIATIVGALFLLLNEVIDICPPTQEQLLRIAKRKRFFKRFLIGIGIILVVSLVKIFIGIYNDGKYQSANYAFQKTCISPSEIVLTDMVLNGTKILSGRVTNLSKEHTLGGITLMLKLIDTQSNGHSEIIGNDMVFVLSKYGSNLRRVPPGETRSFEVGVYFADLPTIKGKLSWTYKLDSIESEDSLPRNN